MKEDIARRLVRLRALRHEASSARFALARRQFDRARQWLDFMDQESAREAAAGRQRKDAAMIAWRAGQLRGEALTLVDQESQQRLRAHARHRALAASQLQASLELFDKARAELARTARGCERAEALRGEFRQAQRQQAMRNEMLVDEDAALASTAAGQGGRR